MLFRLLDKLDVIKSGQCQCQQSLQVLCASLLWITALLNGEGFKCI